MAPRGSAKTTTAKFLRSVIDPSQAETLHLSNSPTELAQILEHHAVPLFDNLRWIKVDTGDMLCAAVTGGGVVKRKLFSNEDDVIFTYKRPLIMTSINTPTAAPDLIDRFLLIRTVVPTKRRSEEELWKSFRKEQSVTTGWPSRLFISFD
jgi:hypothetical protein